MNESVTEVSYLLLLPTIPWTVIDDDVERFAQALETARDEARLGL